MIQVINIPAFTDNYIWLLSNEERKYAAIVDPGDAQVVIDELNVRQMQPIAVLITHHHRDHVGGVKQLLAAYPELKVYGPAQEAIPNLMQPLREGDTVNLEPLALNFEVLDIPGHTAGHIAYYGEGSLFCGDTVFGAGCGRVFDGSMEELFESLRKLAALPSDTLIYCAHEYTVDNLGFAKWVEPDNQDIDERLAISWSLLDAGRATVPFTLEGEFQTNPFLRVHIPEVIAKAEDVAKRHLNAPSEVFAALRIWKDTEYD